jgi:DNA-directed RNA polymerase subunit RPC12/RpoP
MLVFPCNVCQTSLSADESQAGLLVRCPTCMSTLRVPTPAPARAGAGAQQREYAGAGVGGGGASIGAGGGAGGTMAPPHLRGGLGGGTTGIGRRFGFNCGYCSSRLEATESMSSQEGQCPTCGNAIIIPILDRYGRLIDPMTGKIIKPDPHPVHAYAAAGDRAPTIVNTNDGKQAIACPRCRAVSPITSNNCKSCGMPFTMEGTTLEASGTSNGFCVASLVLGIIGLPAACAVIPSVLAIIFGIIGYTQVQKSGVEGGGKGMAIAGIICGIAGTLLGAKLLLG